MPESHEPERILSVPGTGDALFDGHAVFTDLFKHVDHSLVGAAVQRPPKSTDAGGDGGIDIDLTGSHHPYGRGGTVLLMVCMENPEHIERPYQVRIDLVGTTSLSNIMFRKLAQ